MSATISTIPAGYFVDVVPGVISAGQTGISMSGLMLVDDGSTPLGQVLEFPNLAAVQTYYGAGSIEATEAAVYFARFNLATKPAAPLLFAGYPLTAAAAYVQGGITGLTLAQLQALTGTLSITTDVGTYNNSGNPFTSLSSATSFTDACQWLLGTYLFHGPTQASFTGSIGATFTGSASASVNLTASSVVGLISIGDRITGTGITGTVSIVSQSSGTTGGAGVYVTSSATSASGTITGASLVLDVTAVASGTISVGNQVVGSGLNGVPFVASQATGTTGGVGTYNLSFAPANDYTSFPSAAMTACIPAISYNANGQFVVLSGTTGTSSSVNFPTGTLATALGLTAATGAVQSVGAAAAVPGTFMSQLLTVTTNWACFQTLFDPDGGSGNTQKLLFAAWANSTNNGYAYHCTDTDITPTESTAATSSLGYILKQSNSSGTAPIYQPVGGHNHLASFLSGVCASINFNATNGRITADYKSQSGIVPSVTSATVQTNLKANGYNSYVSVATAGVSWQFYDPGSITGPFTWWDSYINQIWLNNQIVVALMTLLTSVGRIPFNPVGYNMIRQTICGGAATPLALPPASPVAAGLNNGIITPNVTLSAEQIVTVNSIAGFPIDSVLSTQGYYLVIQPATAATRGARQSPTIILFYMDGGSVQQINVSSLLVQ